MAKRLLEIDSLDAFHIAAILKTAKPRRKALRESLSMLQNSITEVIAEADAREVIRAAVVKAVVETVHFPPPVSGSQALAGMGYTAPTYAKLAAKMTVIVQYYKPSASVLPSEVVKAKSVDGCVALAIQKAGV